MTKKCIFCNYSQEKVVDQNELAFAIYDGYPVNKGHLLIIPKRHVANFFELSSEELASINELLKRNREKIALELNATGFNVGVNVGEDAGQTVFHVHVHLIPRFKGDVEDPRGGIRNFKKPLVDYP